jgi:SAM-dependent methyltransferase
MASINGIVNDREKQRVDWNSLAKRNTNKTHIDPLIGRYKSDEFLCLVKRWLPNLHQKTILKTDLREEAFGTDEVLFSLPQQECRMFGIDIAPRVVQAASLNPAAREHFYIAGDVRNLPFADNTFDIVLSNSTLDHFDQKNDFLRALNELQRVMKKDGRLLLTLNNKHNLNFRCMAACETLLKTKSYPVCFFSLRDIQKACSSAGLEIVQHDAIVHIISPFNSLLLVCRRIFPIRISTFIARACIAFARFLGHCPLTKRFTGWFLAVSCIVKDEGAQSP